MEMKTYRLLIVDDEPIILSGIKSLLNWDSLGVEIAGTARNGREALVFIENHHPDIVIADIKMPIMDGISLLKESNERFPDIVFIMLSSLEEFRLAKEAISYRAVDYLLKIELDENLLRKAIVKARDESDRRSIFSKKDDGDFQSSQAERYISNLLKFREVVPEVRRSLVSSGMMESYAFLSVIISEHPEIGSDSFDEDMERRISWLNEIVSRLLSPYFPVFHEVNPVSSRNSMVIFFLSGFPLQSWKRNMTALSEKIRYSSKMVLNQNVDIVYSSSFSGIEELGNARDDFELEMTRHYLGKEEVVDDDLRLDNTISKIERCLYSKDSQAFDVTIRIIRDRLENADHTRVQAAFFFEAFGYAVRSGFRGTDLESEGLKIAERIEHDLEYMTKREDSLRLLDGIGRDISSILSSRESHNEAIAKAKLYILSHLEKQLSLTEIADNSCISPGYLSALFKKTTGISVVDYVNQAKIEKAKEMIAGGMRRVDEMASLLGFENIYYFSKVFKKFTGLPPTEYARKIEDK